MKLNEKAFDEACNVYQLTGIFEAGIAAYLTALRDDKDLMERTAKAVSDFHTGYAFETSSDTWKADCRELAKAAINAILGEE